MSEAHEEIVSVLLVGRPNSGKSSLYNQVCGGRAKIGNFPGVTVDVLEAPLVVGAQRVSLVDLPGIYALTDSVDADTDEGITQRYLADARRKGRAVVIQVLDATRLELGLGLTQDLEKQGLPILLVVSQCDRLASLGLSVDTAQLAEATGHPAIQVSSRDPASGQQVLSALAQLLVDARSGPGPDLAWTPKAMAAAVCKRKDGSKARAASFDRVLLHPVLGPVCFLGIMASLFAAVFMIADPASSLVDAGVALLSKLLTKVLGDTPLKNFLTEGVLGGAGTVLAFLPQIVLLAVALEVLDASGYLVRGTFLLDRLLQLFRLSGRSFLPLLMAHACAVPAISSTRIIRDPKERLTTILVLPLMQCSARLPTYALLLGVFFSDRGVWFRAGLFVFLYFAGIVASLAASLVLRRSALRGRPLPLLMEMPNYLVPQVRVIGQKALGTCKSFLRDVGTTILVVSSVLWLLLHIPTRSDASVPLASRSVAAAVGRAAEPVTQYAGFDWRINVALIGAFGARELMVSTLGVIMEVEAADDDVAPLAAKLRGETDKGFVKGGPAKPMYPLRTGLALMVFFVLACQCMSTLAAVRRETRSIRWPVFVFAYTYAAALLAATLVFQCAKMMGF
jgi:ferrous iron transport protein B